MDSDLSIIKLVTLDIFGTVLDWRGFVERLVPGRYQDFLARSEALQRCDLPLLPYAKVIGQVLTQMGISDEIAVAIAAERFGAASPFVDFVALSYLRSAVLMGCVSNSDHRHQTDVQRTLGFPWDICVLSEDTRHYKPAEAMWTAAVERVHQELKLDPAQWLHVSAFSDYDLEPAAKCGIKTCFVPRPGGSDAADLSAEPSLIVSDLYDLADRLCSNLGKPVFYQVTCTAEDEQTHQRFQKWMRYEHGQDVMRSRGCTSFCVFEAGPTVSRCQYVFASSAALQEYLAHRAPTVRKRALELFGEDALKFERSSYPIVSGGCDRRSLRN